MLRLGVIGFGGRVADLIATLDTFQAVEIAAITDTDRSGVEQRLQNLDKDSAKIHFYTDPDEMLDRERLHGVMIGTRGHLHSKMAIKVLQRGIPLYLEKPVATNLADLLELKRAADSASGETIVSFPLRVTPLARRAKEIIDSGQIGTVEHVQAFNNVPYGGVYYHYWYRDETYDGGLWLAKTTHDFDYINHLLGIQPRWISAIESKRVFRGSYPAGLACKDCADQLTCPESPYNQYLAGEIEAIDQPAWEPYLCAFAVDTGNQDSGSAIIEYETGMHVVYSQNFYARKGAGRRGAILLGYKGTIEFDWYTSELKVMMHHTPRIEVHKVEVKGGHLGGDAILMQNFIHVMSGKERSCAPLQAGILSALMCLKAKEAVKSRKFEEIVLPANSD